jgi:hypothetical protein
MAASMEERSRGLPAPSIGQRRSRGEDWSSAPMAMVAHLIWGKVERSLGEEWKRGDEGEMACSRPRRS